LPANSETCIQPTIHWQWSLPSRKGKPPERFQADNSWQTDRADGGTPPATQNKNFYAL
jgi:hypothetical protein